MMSIIGLCSCYPHDFSHIFFLQYSMYYLFTLNFWFLGNRQIRRRGHGRGTSEPRAVPPAPECHRGSPDEGHECCRGSLWGRENVSAPGDQVGTSDEESSGSSHTFHGKRERREDETNGECCECLIYCFFKMKFLLEKRLINGMLYGLCFQVLFTVKIL